MRIESGRQINLIHLSLSYNQITNEDLEEICSKFPNLFCLDVSFNDICNFSWAYENISEMENLKMIYFMGNPLALSFKYRDILKQRLENLKIIDGTPTLEEGSSPSKKKKKKNAEPEKIIEI